MCQYFSKLITLRPKHLISTIVVNFLYIVQNSEKRVNKASPGRLIGVTIGGFFFGIIVVVIAAYIAKRRRLLKDEKKKIVQTDANDNSKIPSQSNGKNDRKISRKNT